MAESRHVVSANTDSAIQEYQRLRDQAINALNRIADASEQANGKFVGSINNASASLAAMGAVEQTRAGLFARTWAETKNLFGIATTAAINAQNAFEGIAVDPSQFEVGDESLQSVETWSERAASLIGTGIGSGVAVAKEVLADLYDTAKRTVEVAAVAFITGISALILSTVYAVYKGTSFAIGLITGESYKSVNIDALRVANEEVKKTQSSMKTSAENAAVLNEALIQQNVTLGTYKSTMADVAGVIAKNSDELDRLGIEYEDQNGNALATQAVLRNALTAIESYSQGWERHRAAVAIGLGTEEEIKDTLRITTESLAVAQQRLIDYQLVIGAGTQKAVAEYEGTMRQFKHESDLTGQGFRHAIADNIMPILTSLADYFKEGFPFAVRAFRYTLATITTLLYGLKEMVYLVGEGIMTIAEDLSSGVTAYQKSLMTLFSGDVSGAAKILIQDWMDAEKRQDDMLNNMFAQSQSNLDAIKLAWGADNWNVSGIENAAAKTGKSFTEAEKPAKDFTKELRNQLAVLLDNQAALTIYADATEHQAANEVARAITAEKYNDLTNEQKNELLALAAVIDTVTAKNKLLTEASAFHSDSNKQANEAAEIMQSGTTAANAYTDALARLAAGKLALLSVGEQQVFLEKAHTKVTAEANRSAATMADATRQNIAAVQAEILALQQDSQATKYNAEQKTALALANTYATEEYRNAALALAQQLDDTSKVADAARIGPELEARNKALGAELILDDRRRAQTQVQIEVDKYQKIIAMGEEAYAKLAAASDGSNAQQLAVNRMALDRSKLDLAVFAEAMQGKYAFEQAKAVKGAETGLEGQIAKLKQAAAALLEYKDGNDRAKRAEIEFETTVGKFKSISPDKKQDLLALADQADALTARVRLLGESKAMADAAAKTDRDAELILVSGTHAVTAYTDALGQLAAGKLKHLSQTEQSTYLQAALNKAQADGRKEFANQVAALEHNNQVLQDEVDNYGKLPAAISLATVAKLQAYQAAVGLNSGVLDGVEQEVFAVGRLIAAYQTQAQLQGQLAEKEVAKKGLDDLTQFLDPAKAKSFGDALADGFGKAGGALGKLAKTFQDYAKQQTDFSAQRANAVNAYLGGLTTEKQFTEQNAQLRARSEQAQLGAYGDLAGAAAGFFNEHSRGYRALTTVSQVFHAAELAHTVAELVPKAISAVLTQGQGDPYTAFGRMAAMAALVAGLGVAVSGGGSASVPVSQQRQAAAGTGSVLGDESAKSASIANSLASLEKLTGTGLDYSAGMLDALRSINAGISGLGRVVAQNLGLQAPKGNEGFQSNAIGRTLGTGIEILAGGGPGVTNLLSKIPLIGGFLSGTISKLSGFVSGLFGSTVTILDTGIALAASTLGTIQTNGIQGVSYLDQEIKKKFLGITTSTSTNRNSTDLPAELEQQFSLVVQSMRAGLLASITAIGAGGDDLVRTLDAMAVKIPDISLKGLKPEEVQKQLEAVFSKLGDDLARQAAPYLGQFQKVGEGLFETLTRIASGYQTIDNVFDSIGKTFRLVGQDSLAAREHLIELTGGLDKFASSGAHFLKNFFTADEQNAALKAKLQPQLQPFGLSLAGPDPVKAFKDTVIALDTTTDAGARAYATLMQLAPIFKQVADADLAATKKIADERKTIQDQVDQLTLTSAQTLERQRAALDASNRALFDQLSKKKQEQETHLLNIQLLEATGHAEEALRLQRQDTLNALLSDAARAEQQKIWVAQEGKEQHLLNIQLLEATGHAEEALRLQRQDTLASLLSDAARLTQTQIWVAKDAAAALLKVQTSAKEQQQKIDTARQAVATAYNNESGALKTLIAQHQQAAASLRAFAAGLYSGADSPLAGEAKLRGLKGQMRNADAEKIQGLATAYLSELKAQSATAQSYDAGFDDVQQALKDTADSTDRQVIAEMQQLLALQEQVAGIEGVRTAVLSLQDALLAYRGVGGKVGNGAGAGAWNGEGVTLANGNIWDSRTGMHSVGTFTAAQAANATPVTTPVTIPLTGAYAKGGFAPAGFALVGEEGPEIVNFTQPGRVMTASQTRQALQGGGTDPAAEARIIQAVVNTLKPILERIATNTNTTAKVLDRAVIDNVLQVSAPQ